MGIVGGVRGVVNCSSSLANAARHLDSKHMKCVGKERERGSRYKKDDKRDEK